MGGSKDGGEARGTGGSKYSRSPARAWMEPAERGTPAPRPRSPRLAAGTRCAVRGWGPWPAGWGHWVHPRGGERTGAARRCGDLRLFRAPPARLLEAQKSSISGSRVSPKAGHHPLPPVSTPGGFSSGPSRAALTVARAHTLVCTQRRTHPWTHKRRPGRNVQGETGRLVSLPAGSGHSLGFQFWFGCVAICESSSHHWVVTCRTKAPRATGSETAARRRPACPRGCGREGGGDALPASGTRVGGEQAAVERRVVAGGGFGGRVQGKDSEANGPARAKAVMGRFARLAPGLGDFTARLWSPPGPGRSSRDKDWASPLSALSSGSKALSGLWRQGW